MTSSSRALSSQLLIGELIKRASHLTPDKEAVIYKDQRKSFQELDDTATQLAGWLQAKGIAKEDKIGFMLKNSMAFMEVAIAAPLSGGVGVPINFRLGESTATYIINHSDTKILFIDVEYLPLIEAIKDDITHVEHIVLVYDDPETTPHQEYINYQDIFSQNTTYKPCEDLVDNDPGFIMYTSGTTGKPKGAVITHKNICQNVMNLMYDQRSVKGESQLLVAPQFHIAGLLLTFKSIAVNGKTVIHRDFHPVALLDTIEKEKINMFFLVPAMWNFLFQVPNIKDYDLSTVRTCATGAAITPLELKKRILDHFPNAVLADNFGQTETTATTTVLYGQAALEKPTSVGLPSSNVEIRVVDEAMNDVPVGQVGEIVYRGPTIMPYYYKNDQATAEAFTGGWFHSGDLVEVDKDGFIYVVDRKVNMINSGGENIYPAEVEEVLYQMDEILECAVIGTPDDHWGEAVTAIIVLKPEQHLSAQAIIDYCKAKLASYKKPKHVVFHEALPRNASGKVLKYVLQKEVKV